MRIKNKIYCSKCGKYLFKLIGSEMNKINKDKLQGTRTNCNYFCKNNCNYY